MRINSLQRLSIGCVLYEYYRLGLLSGGIIAWLQVYQNVWIMFSFSFSICAKPMSVCFYFKPCNYIVNPSRTNQRVGYKNSKVLVNDNGIIYGVDVITIFASRFLKCTWISMVLFCNTLLLLYMMEYQPQFSCEYLICKRSS